MKKPLQIKTLQIGVYKVTLSATINGEDATDSFLRLIALALYEASEFHAENHRPFTAHRYKIYAFNISSGI